MDWKGLILLLIWDLIDWWMRITLYLCNSILSCDFEIVSFVIFGVRDFEVVCRLIVWAGLLVIDCDLI
jgi:hypothetical protein